MIKQKIFYLTKLMSFLTLLLFYFQTYGDITQLHEEIKKAWQMMATRLPQDKNSVVAVLPIIDDAKGIRRLGFYCAELIKTEINTTPSKAQVVERSKLDNLMKEREAWVADFFDKSATGIQNEGKILKADYLLMGILMPTASKVYFSLELIYTATGEVVGTVNFKIDRDDEINELLWFVQHPEKEIKPAQKVEEKKQEITVPPLEIHYTITATRADIGEKIIVRDNTSLNSGDWVKISFTPISDCWVYLLYHSSQGKWDTLFPHPEIKLGNYCRGGVTYHIPDPDIKGYERAFQLDDNTGEETLFFIASYAPLDDITVLLDELNQATASERNMLSRKLENAIRTRGIEQRKIPGIELITETKSTPLITSNPKLAFNELQSTTSTTIFNQLLREVQKFALQDSQTSSTTITTPPAQITKPSPVKDKTPISRGIVLPTPIPGEEILKGRFDAVKSIKIKTNFFQRIIENDILNFLIINIGR